VQVEVAVAQLVGMVLMQERKLPSVVTAPCKRAGPSSNDTQTKSRQSATGTSEQKLQNREHSQIRGDGPSSEGWRKKNSSTEFRGARKVPSQSIYRDGTPSPDPSTHFETRERRQRQRIDHAATSSGTQCDVSLHPPPRPPPQPCSKLLAGAQIN
jgi:hypothetical protein